MSDKTIDINAIADTIVNELAGYTQQVADGVKAAADETAAELLANTKRDAPARTGKYRRAMAIKTAYEDNGQKRIVWYVKPPHYRLTHLLEYGHVKRSGGRVRAYPHIAKNEQLAKERFEARVKEVIEHAGDQ